MEQVAVRPVIIPDCNKLDAAYEVTTDYLIKQADSLFHALLIRCGVNSVRALLMLEAVQNFGSWYWENDLDDLHYLSRLRQRLIDDGGEPALYGLQGR